MRRDEIIGSVLALLVLGGTVCMAQDAAEEDAVEVEDEGESTITFGFGLGLLGSYHSNPYYRDSANEADGFVWSADPYFRFDVPLNEMLYFGADLRAKITHVAFSDAGEDDKSIAHPFLQGKVRYNLSEHTSFSLIDDFQTANVEDVGDKPRFTLNNASLGFAHAFSEALETTFTYRNTIVEQTDDSLLFDSVEHTVFADADWIVSRMDSGRGLTVGLRGQYGIKEFDDGNFFQQTTRENPKTHDFYRLGGAVTYPLSSLLTVYARLGWLHREYDVTGGRRDSETDSPYGGLSATHLVSPGSPVSFTVATSYDVADTIVYNIESQDRGVFETTDALLNNLNVAYRELNVLRVGFITDYNIMRMLLGLSLSYQRQDADAGEDLAPISGNMTADGIGRATEQEQFSVTATARYRVAKAISLGVGFQYGVAEDSELSGETDLYDYSSFALLAELDL